MPVISTEILVILTERSEWRNLNKTKIICSKKRKEFTVLAEKPLKETER